MPVFKITDRSPVTEAMITALEVSVSELKTILQTSPLSIRDVTSIVFNTLLSNAAAQQPVQPAPALQLGQRDLADVAHSWWNFFGDRPVAARTIDTTVSGALRQRLLVVAGSVRNNGHVSTRRLNTYLDFVKSTPILLGAERFNFVEVPTIGHRAWQLCRLIDATQAQAQVRRDPEAIVRELIAAAALRGPAAEDEERGYIAAVRAGDVPPPTAEPYISLYRIDDHEAT